VGKGERWRREEEGGKKELSSVKIPYGKKGLSPSASAAVCQPHAGGRRKGTTAQRLDPLIPEVKELVRSQPADPTSARSFISGKSHPEQQGNATATYSREKREDPHAPGDQKGGPTSLWAKGIGHS